MNDIEEIIINTKATENIEPIRTELIEWKKGKKLTTMQIKKCLGLTLDPKAIERVFNERYPARIEYILEVYENYKGIKTKNYIQQNNEKAAILNKQLIDSQEALAFAKQEMLSIENEIEIYKKSKKKEPIIYILEEEIKKVAIEYEFYDDVECMSEIDYKDKKIWGNIIDKKVLINNEDEESELIIFTKANNKYLVCILDDSGKYWVDRINTIDDVIEALLNNINDSFTSIEISSITEDVRLELELI